MKILSLFDGISCARVALERAGIPVKVYYASEIDKYAMQIARKNWPKMVQLGDIKDLPPSNLGKIDLLIGGSPCQDLSIANKNRKGLDGSRSGLFWEYVRILKEVKPRYFILENVNSMSKESKDIITKELGVESIMINASLLSAQSRKRLFWTNIPNIKQPEDKGILLKHIIEKKVDEKYFLTKDNKLTPSKNPGIAGTLDTGTWLKRYEQIRRVYNLENKSPTLPTGTGGGVMTKILIIPEATKKGYAIATEGQSVDFSFPTSKTRRGRVGDKAKNIMTSSTIGVFTQGIVRRLTPIECERLQGLPDNYTGGGYKRFSKIQNSW